MNAKTLDRQLEVIEWLSQGLRDEAASEKIFVHLCERLMNAGIALSRATLHFRVHHPQWLGTRVIWTRGLPEVDVHTVAYDVEATDVFLRSPFRVVIATGNEVRQRIRIHGPHIFPIYEELRQQGHTDYAAWPLDHTQGRRHLITFATDRPTGFDDADIALIRSVLPIFSLITEIRLKNQLARTLLQTYVGPHASEQILDGATTRGSGTTLSAAIMICDLRNFTLLSGSQHRDRVIEILNEYFDLMADPIEKHGGEILKFMGDGLLAVFPLDEPGACQRLIAALAAAYEASARRSSTKFPVQFGTGVHVGEVMYGNIGSKRRLDFTVIGPAVNLASRLETLTKQLKRPVLISGDFVASAGCAAQTDCLGMHSVKGFDEMIEVHALRI
ncbi:adenylate/guanylate cyclase domain-containing protein (plasmid) [Rhizobium grahamii]|uniref:Adenylate/guanylate cyclase domain-containing protein n=1 Tax=Rhizobium grahamii TaxID=1120045 RepID=A0A5Q0CGV2_9HYPH|nr:MULTISPECIES: adenylate/guanylate cyclase domain-containing protein [Rhizobium]QFY63347.1 adenylate/guanylate cyclase domain-containing protein [Rhizobium grahamii]QRM51890.1 adenylate/guanylate cyclase domain-containing protein [Rhizobium sp. BG6]